MKHLSSLNSTGCIKCVQTADFYPPVNTEMDTTEQPTPVKTLTKEEKKALREAEKTRPKRKYIKKKDRMVGIKVSHEPVLISFD